MEKGNNKIILGVTLLVIVFIVSGSLLAINRLGSKVHDSSTDFTQLEVEAEHILNEVDSIEELKETGIKVDEVFD